VVGVFFISITRLEGGSQCGSAPTWGWARRSGVTVVLAAACPACAVGTGIAAYFRFGFAGSLVYVDGVPDRLLYLLPVKS
jgi:hypothetical protein